jgi:hypothetical protein
MKTYKDIYKFPLNKTYGSWVYDQIDNFVFQFCYNLEDEKEDRLINVINGNEKLTNPELSFKHEGGYILTNKDQKVILIRGWGNLTGVGGHNLPPEEAANIQDTFAEFIVEQLNKR